MTRSREITGIALLAVGFVFVGYGLFIPAKAVLAQVLLERAWIAAPKDGKAPKPWPWADTKPIARIKVGDLDVSEIILAGAHGRSLPFGGLGTLMARQSPAGLDIVLLPLIATLISHFLRILKLAWRSVWNCLVGNLPVMWLWICVYWTLALKRLSSIIRQTCLAWSHVTLSTIGTQEVPCAMS